MSEEDRKLKEKLELLVTRIKEKVETDEQAALQITAMQMLGTEIKSSTSSMTAVPKPLKFLRPHYDTIKATYAALERQENKLLLADILSVLAMTMAPASSREMLRFKLQGTKDGESLTQWGHEYIRSLAGEIGQEYADRSDKKESTDDLLSLVDTIVPFSINHSAEVEAVDLLIEVQQLQKLTPLVSKDHISRVCQYLLQSADYIGDPDDSLQMVQIAFDCYMQCHLYADALRVAIRLNQSARISQVLEACQDPLMKQQLAFLLAANRTVLQGIELDEEMQVIISNSQLSSRFQALAADLDVKDAKTPEDIYKTHLVETAARMGAPAVDSAKQNLASSFVNAFVNCGFSKDKLLTIEGGSEWVFKNKAHGMMSAAASLGLLYLWDTETGFNEVDKYSHSAQTHIKAGAVLATGLLTSGVSSEMDPALMLLSEHLEGTNAQLKSSACLGLGLAYAGSCRQDLLELLVPIVVDSSQPIEVTAMAALALGQIFVGSADSDVSSSIIQGFLDRTETDLKDSVARLMCLGLGLVFLGKGEEAETTLLTIAAIEHPINKYLETTVKSCASAASRSVLDVQSLLGVLSEHMDDDEKNPLANAHQSVAVIGVALTCVGDDLTEAMALRALDHVLQYGEVNIRRAVPLALALLSVSNPRMAVMDTLSKLSHDQDEIVSQTACLALGFIGAGTNNSRIAHLLRGLAGFYAKEPNHLFLVRIAQGLLHLGKGLMSLSPFYSDNLLMSKVAMAGLLVVMHASTNLKHTLLGDRHHLLYALGLTIRPRMLVTLDENLQSIQVPVRVGQAVDTVGQVGKPKAITGFQTLTTPVLLAHGQRCELATDEYIPLTSVLEGFVILRKNPEATAAKKA